VDIRTYNWRDNEGTRWNMPLIGFCFRYALGRQCYRLQVFFFGRQADITWYTPLEKMKRMGWIKDKG